MAFSLMYCKLLIKGPAKNTRRSYTGDPPLVTTVSTSTNSTSTNFSNIGIKIVLFSGILLSLFVMLWQNFISIHSVVYVTWNKDNKIEKFQKGFAIYILIFPLIKNFSALTLAYFFRVWKLRIAIATWSDVWIYTFKK